MLTPERYVQAISEAKVGLCDIAELIELAVNRMSNVGEEVEIEVQPSVWEPETLRTASPLR